MSEPIQSNMMGAALAAEGLLPDGWECRKFELVATVNDMIVLRYEIQVTPDLLPKIARVMDTLRAKVTSQR